MLNARRWDHPRACGEHTTAANAATDATGSSPRMRGTPSDLRLRLRYGGIIPAHAGNTSTGCRPAADCRDHPRACGEHRRFIRRLHIVEGSSPRMRGTQPIPAGESLLERIIPAHAGNTLWRRTRTSSSGDHPRACGEHAQRYASRRLVGGSSPRMRGTLFHGHHEDKHTGIIPAHAGNTRLTCRPSNLAWDHPRACGEHKGKRSRRDVNEGSSPRMRGTRLP